MPNHFYFIVFIIILLVLFFIGMLIFILLRIKKCPSDKIMVIYGLVDRKNKELYKCIHGGARFVWPFVQSYKYLDLNPIYIDIELKQIMATDNKKIDINSKFTVGISTEHNLMKNAAERLLGLNPEEIREIAKNIIIGQLNLLISSANIDKIKNDKNFLSEIVEIVNNEINKIGLFVINANLFNILENNNV